LYFSGEELPIHAPQIVVVVVVVEDRGVTVY